MNRFPPSADATPPQLTEYLSKHTIHKCILNKIKKLNLSPKPYDFVSLEEMLLNLDGELCHELLFNILPAISILDPACGPGDFLLAALNVFFDIYMTIIDKTASLSESNLAEWLKTLENANKNLHYSLKKKIIVENLFGVDINKEAVEITCSRLYMALIASANEADEKDLPPNIHFNVKHGNALIGLLHTKGRNSSNKFVQLSLAETTNEQDSKSLKSPNELLTNEFNKLRIHYEKTEWDPDNNREVKTKRQKVQLSDIEMLHPFHWDLEFNWILERGGFDVIITNPPWERLKQNDKEFFVSRSSIHYGMPNADYKSEHIKLLEDPQLRQEWLKYINHISIQCSFFTTTSQYRHQGAGLDFYMLFTEQCYKLLCSDSMCGLILPSGIYSDQTSKQLREMLFQETEIQMLLGFENSNKIFAEVPHSLKFALLIFKKGGHTQRFPVAFKLHYIDELEHIPKRNGLVLSVDLIRRNSPELLAIMEFKNGIDLEITEKKLLQHPPLSEKPKIEWDFELTNEFHMTDDSHLFRSNPGPNSLPLYEGKMIHQFSHRLGEPRFWVDAVQGREVLIKQELQRVTAALDSIAASYSEEIRQLPNSSERVSTLLQELGYQELSYNDIYIDADAPRLTFRNAASTTDQRTLIATILPPGVFAGNALTYIKPWRFNARKILDIPSRVSDCYESTFSITRLAYLCGVFNSFVLDYQLRLQASMRINLSSLYRLAVPRLYQNDQRYIDISNLTARLICADPDFDTMRQELLSKTEDSVAYNSEERVQIQSEIDSRVANIYNLNEKEFMHILDSFPRVKEDIKDRAKKAFITFEFAQGRTRLATLLRGGENHKVEFKVASYWNETTQKKEDGMKNNILEEVAAFLNSQEGGTILIGVDDTGKVVGLENDYQAVNSQKKDRDGYQLFLLDLLKDNLNGNYSLFYHISFSVYEGKEICIIDVDPSPNPVFLKRKEEFYIRDGARKIKLSAQKAIEYFKERWR